MVSELLREGANPNEPPKGWYGKSALQAAAVAGHLPIIRLLLDAGAEVDAPGGIMEGIQRGPWLQGKETPGLLIRSSLPVQM